MTEKPERPRKLSPDEARIQTFVIYDAKSGDLVHGHKAVVLPYGDAPSEKELAEEALETAVEVTKRDRGELRLLEVSEDDLEPGAFYRVDPESERLERVKGEAAG